MKAKCIFFGWLFLQLCFVIPAFSVEKEIFNVVEFCEKCPDEELPLALVLAQHMDFLTAHNESQLSMLQIREALKNIQKRLNQSDLVSLEKKGKFCIKGEVTHIVYKESRLSVPEYFLTSNANLSCRNTNKQSGVDTPYENCPQTIKDYGQYPITKLSEDKFCDAFIQRYGGIFNSPQIEKCFQRHLASCSLFITVDAKTENIKTFSIPINIESKIAANDENSGVTGNRLILNFMSDKEFFFQTTKGYLKKFYSVDPTYTLHVKGPKYGFEELGFTQTTETDEEWLEKIFQKLQAKYPDKKELLKALDNIGSGRQKWFRSSEPDCSFEPFDGIGTYTVSMSVDLTFLPRTLEETRIFLLSKDINNKNCLLAAYNGETTSGLQRIRSAIKANTHYSLSSNKLKIQFTPVIELFKPATKEDADWTTSSNRMPPGSVYFVNDSINVKIDYAQPANGESIDNKVLQIRKFKDDKPLKWQDIPFSTLDWRFSPNQKHLYITIPWKRLVEIGFCQEDTNDKIPEFASLDYVKNAKSNLNDSLGLKEYAISAKALNRGNAQGGFGITEKIAPPLTLLSKDFLKSAGVEFVQISFQKMESSVFQIQNQADIFYFSGHGDAFNGELEMSCNDKITPSEAILAWDQDLMRIFLAGCSVLKIKNYNNKFQDNPEKAKASPGEKWAKLKGKIFYGYCAGAPSDTNSFFDGADTTKNILMNFFKLGGKPEDWLTANNNRYGRNACVIITTSIPWRYGCIREYNGIYIQWWVAFDHKTGSWP